MRIGPSDGVIPQGMEGRVAFDVASLSELVVQQPGGDDEMPVINNVADLRLYHTPPTDFMAITLLGLITPADGGGGVFSWHSASTVPDDGANSVTPTGFTGPGRWLRDFPPVPAGIPAFTGGQNDDVLVVCEAAVQVLDAVYLKATDLYARANATGIATMPVEGFVVFKPTATSAYLRAAGSVPGLTLVADTEYFAAESDGQITDTPPTTPGHVLQSVGRAENATTLTAKIYEPTVL